MMDLPLEQDVWLFPELTALCTLEVALEMSVHALYLSYPGLTECEPCHDDADYLAALTVLRSIRFLLRHLHAYRRVLADSLNPE